MARIHRLPQTTASHLRSSCIVSSVPQIIDELVCNSIDARAAQIRVCLDLGSRYVKVEDDGEGITRDDFALLGERYATSKLFCLEDLEAGPQTLGFRGEGLSSISDTGLVEVTSKSKGSPHTYRKIIKNSRTLSMGLTEDQRDPGTTVVVKDVFYNQPVRTKQFLSSSRKVLDSVKDQIVRVALVHPKIWFSVTDLARQETVFQAKAAGSLFGRINDIFGKETGDCLKKIDYAKAAFRLSGYVSQQLKFCPRKALQHLYINRRFVQKTPLHKLLTSWNTESSLAPAFVLNLACPLVDYDITADASKTLVEFKDWSPVVAFVKEVLQQLWSIQEPKQNITVSPGKRKRHESGALNSCKKIDPSLKDKKIVAPNFAQPEPKRRPPVERCRASLSAPPFEKPRKNFGRSQGYEKMKAPEEAARKLQAPSEKEVALKAPSVEEVRVKAPSEKEVGDPRELCKWRTTTPCTSMERPVLEVGSGILSSSCYKPDCVTKEMLAGTRVLGQVDKKFIAAVSNGILFFIDQHAADERVRLEEFRNDILNTKEGHMKSLGDATKEVTLTRLEHEMLTTYKKKVEYWGWHSFSVFSRSGQRNFATENCSVVVTAVPCIKGVDLTTEDLVEYLHQLSETHGSSAPPPAVLRVLNFKACRGAIMFGDALLPSECEQLVNALKKTALCFQCAHGRPTTVPIVNLKALRGHRRQFQFDKHRATNIPD